MHTIFYVYINWCLFISIGDHIQHKNTSVKIVSKSDGYASAKKSTDKDPCINIVIHPNASMEDDDCEMFKKCFDYHYEKHSIHNHVSALEAFHKTLREIENDDVYIEDNILTQNKYEYQNIYKENHAIIIHNVTENDSEKLQQYIELQKYDETKSNNDWIKGRTFIKNNEFPELSVCVFTFNTQKSKDITKNIIEQKIKLEGHLISNDYINNKLPLNQNFGYYLTDLPKYGYPSHYPYRSHNKWLFTFNGKIVNRNIVLESRMDNSFYSNSTSIIGDEIFMDIENNKLKWLKLYNLNA